MDASKTFLLYPQGKREDACVLSITAEKIEQVSSTLIAFSRGEDLQQEFQVQIPDGMVIEEIGKS